MDAEEARTIGQRLRMIRRRRGMGLAVAAGLAGISKQYLSLLERGERGFNRRGLLEDLAAALGCSVVDLTEEAGQALTGEAVASVVDVCMGVLALHVRVVTSNSEERIRALAMLAEACKVAYVLAKRTGQIELASIAAQRGLDAARLAERPDLVGMLEMSRTSTLIGLGARRRAAAVCGETLREISALPGPTPDDTRVAEACGMLHLTTALIAGRSGDVETHLAEARSLAAHTGERNHMRYHFGPTNVAAWELGLAVEAGTGPDAAERMAAAPIDFSVFGSKGRTAYVHFDLARAWAQAEGAHDQGGVASVGRCRPIGAGPAA